MSDASTPVNPPKEKTAKELEKERKKAEKLAKLAAKQAKLAQQPAPKKEKPKQEKEAAPEFNDQTKPGAKKILVSLDDPALKAYNPTNVESSWYAWWKAQGHFKPQFDANNAVLPAGMFVIPAPPPNVTGALHIGHALTIAIQDALIRFNRMQGKTTLFLPGFDHAGISTQSVVEKMIWRNDRKTRHDYGREKFVGLVWQWKEEYHERIRRQCEALGASYDWSRESFTMDDARSAAVTEAFVRLFDDGTIYRAERLVNWCVALSTTLSNLELDNKEIAGRTLLAVPGYAEPVEFGVLTSFAYEMENSPERIVVATTRPETMFGDTAIAVHPDDQRYTHLHGKFAVHPFLDRRLPIIADSQAVEMEFGTGAVKITPSHDANDYETGKRNGLEFINVFNEDGTLNANAGPYQGVKRFTARSKVIQDLKDRGLFVEQRENPMTIPLCVKSGDVIEPLMKPQWWVRQKPQAELAIQAVRNGEIKIAPKSSEHEFFHWLENIQDWCVSRQLWWGHRCPVYLVCIEGHDKPSTSSPDFWVAGRSREEARQRAAEKFPGKTFTLEQDEDVLDTWFSSGLWPLSTLGWPENTPDFEKLYPQSMLETGWDILFFWVARMIMLGLKLTGKVPFTEVYCHSLVRDAQGRKMSKSLGNVVDPLDVISGISLDGLHKKLQAGNLDSREVARAEEGQRLSYPNGIPQCGTDALRFALCAYTTGGRDINLSVYRIEGYRKFCNKIYQATKFALMRLGDEYKPSTLDEFLENSKHRALVESWILSKFASAAKQCATNLNERKFMEATSALYNFWLYELCDVYIENSKALILEGSELEKKSARDTLYYCLEGGLRLLSPFMPFLTEELWQRLPKRPQETAETITLTKWPAETSLLHPQAEQDYSFILEVVKATRSVLAQYGVLKNGEVKIYASDKVKSLLEQQSQSIVSLIKAVSSIEVTSEEQTPAGSVVHVVSADSKVFLALRGHIDIDEEINKVNVRLSKSNSLKSQLEKQMGVKDYEAKVKQEVRDNNESKLKSLDADITALEQVICELERLKVG